MSSLVTMVFTDVVKSSRTKRSLFFGRDNRERDNAYLQSVQVPHFKVVRDCMTVHGGREVKTMGDAFFLAFDDPLLAVRCAVEIQRRLIAEPITTPIGPLRLRIGIHSGYPEVFERDYHGTDVDTTARVESVASAGQILASATTYNLVKDMTDVSFHARSVRDLSGIGTVELWEVRLKGQGPAVTPVTWLPPHRKATIAIASLSILFAFELGFQREHGQMPQATNLSTELDIPVVLHLKDGRTNQAVPNVLVTFDRHGVVSTFYSDSSGLVRCQLPPDEYLVKTSYEKGISSRIIRVSQPNVDLDFPVPARP